MAQRFNLEIYKKGTLLANAYYHSSGYTFTAITLASVALRYIIDNITTFLYEEENPAYHTALAIEALEATGATITGDELLAYSAITHTYKAKKPLNKHTGIISFTSINMAKTREYEFMRIKIDMDNISMDISNSYDCITEEEKVDILDWDTQFQNYDDQVSNLKNVSYDEVINLLQQQDTHITVNKNYYLTLGD